MTKNQVVFQCRKCEHLLFVEKINRESIKGIMNMDCPECGEENYANWILLRMGSYEEEYGDK